LLYRLDELVNANPEEWVIIAEGEKDVDKLWTDGFVATTAPNGADSWRPEWAEHFDGRSVAIVPDNDDKGKHLAGVVYRALTARGRCKALKVIDLPGLKVEGDYSDWGGSADELKKLCDEAADPPEWMKKVNENAEVARLAALPPMEYDRERKSAANNLSIKVSTLDNLVAARRPKHDSPQPGSGSAILFEEIEPWPTPVDGPQLFGEVVAALKRHVVFPMDDHAVAVALWVFHAHALSKAVHSPLLDIMAATKNCGKTLLLSVVSELVPRPLQFEDITQAGAARLI
jgi:hypothetical protein